MSVTLGEVELRVLGVLMEKSLTNPAAYPLTINAILVGANQKQNRDPVVVYTEADVSRALHSLAQKDLVKQAPPVPGARANRFEHTVVETFKWDRRDQAVMAELMLRGRQTAGELRGRAGRMTPFESVDSVGTTLRGLAQRDPPFVEELPREAGRSANRFRQLLSSDAGGAPAAGVVHGTVLSEPVPHVREDAGAGTAGTRLEERVAALERVVAELKSTIDAMAAGGAERSGELREPRL